MGLTIRKKLYLSFGLLIAMLTGLGFYANSALENIESEAIVIRDDYVPSLDNLHRLITLETRYRVYQYRHIVAADAQEMNTVEQEMQATEKRMTEVLAAQEKLVSQENMAGYQKVREQWQKMTDLNRQVISLSRAHRSAEAEAVMGGEMKVLFDDISNGLMDLLNGTRRLRTTLPPEQ